MQDTNQDLARTIQVAVDRNSVLETDIVALQQEVAQQTQALTTAEQEKLKLADDAKQSATKLSEMTVTRDTLTTTLERREDSLAKLEAANDALRAHIADLEMQLEKGRRKTDKKALKEVIATETSRIEDELKTAHSEKDALRAELEKNAGEMEALKAEVDMLKSNINEDWQDQKISANLLREQINDMAARIATVNSTYEDDDGVIARIMGASTQAEHSGNVPTEDALVDKIRRLQRFSNSESLSSKASSS